MSRNFIKYFFKTLEQILTNDTRYELNKNNIELWVKSLMITTGISCHCTYTLGTSKNEQLTIVKKYKMVRNGYTEFMVIDENERHFNVNNSLWYWKWNSIEDWTKIKEGDNFNFKYYGWRVPVLGLFPNIYMTNRDQILDSMTNAQFRVFEYKKEYDKINTLKLNYK